MASSPDFVNYICEQLEGLGAVRSRKMFGEYMVYLNDKPVVIICDDRPMVKMLPCLEELLQGRPTEPPYEGAKDHYLLDPDDRDTLREAARLAEEVTPLPKKKAPKQKEPAPAEGPAPWDIVWPQHMKPGRPTGWSLPLSSASALWTRAGTSNIRRGASPCASSMSGPGLSPPW